MENLKFKVELGQKYKSKSQKIRIMSEDWVLNNCYCIKCGKKLKHSRINSPVNDFYCENCGEIYELKSKCGNSNIIPGGQYHKIMEKYYNGTLPNLLYLIYKNDYEISNMIALPAHYFSQASIIPRKPLSKKTRKPNWQGCTINIKNIPSSGKINIIKNSNFVDKKLVVYQFNKTLFLNNIQKKSKGWTLEIIKCIDDLDMNEFTLKYLYDYNENLKNKFPNNNNVEAKIRQQLQILRDENYIEFLGNGIYRRK